MLVLLIPVDPGKGEVLGVPESHFTELGGQLRFWVLGTPEDQGRGQVVPQEHGQRGGSCFHLQVGSCDLGMPTVRHSYH